MHVISAGQKEFSYVQQKLLFTGPQCCVRLQKSNLIKTASTTFIVWTQWDKLILISGCYKNHYENPFWFSSNLGPWLSFVKWKIVLQMIKREDHFTILHEKLKTNPKTLLLWSVMSLNKSAVSGDWGFMSIYVMYIVTYRCSSMSYSCIVCKYVMSRADVIVALSGQIQWKLNIELAHFPLTMPGVPEHVSLWLPQGVVGTI